MKYKFVKILLISMSLVLLFLCGFEKIDIPSDIKNGYIVSNYETYVQPEKINGRKFEKVYVIGKITNEPTISGDELLCSLFDMNNKRYVLILDKGKSELKYDYNNLKDRQICVCGIYGGTSTQYSVPYIYVNKIYDIKDKKLITSKYYENYFGDLDDNGKVISDDYDEDDNTIIDFHSIRLQVPYNYMEKELSNKEGAYVIHDDGVFVLKLIEQNMSEIKYQDYEQLLKLIGPSIIVELYNNYFEENAIKNIKIDFSNNALTFDVVNSNYYGNGMVMLKQEGLYLISLINETKSRFNRTQDFTKIVNSISKLDPPRQPKSVGINKMFYSED